MGESVDLHEEASKENDKRWLTWNLSPAEEATSKDEVKIEKFLQEQKSKNAQCKTERFEHVEEILLNNRLSPVSRIFLDSGVCANEGYFQRTLNLDEQEQLAIHRVI